MIGLYSYTSDNIGDDMQSLVLRRWLGYNEDEVVLVDRDKHTLHGETDGEIDLLINAFIGGGVLPIHEADGVRISPVFVAAHFYRIDRNGPEKIAQLKEVGPVGCRDVVTLHRCQERGIPAYFAGCPTILCEPAPVKEDIDILLVDVNPRTLPNLPEKRIRYSSNMISKKTSQSDRRDMCLRRWEMLSRSRLVVTSKLHAAMPALGMGKPVVFIHEKVIAPRRLTAFPEEFRIYKQGQEFSWDPDFHRCDTSERKSLVESRLHEHVGRFRKDHPSDNEE